MSDLGTTCDELREAWRRLQTHWEEAKTMWDDSVRQRFEKEHWTLLEEHVFVVLKEMERLSQVVAQARRNVR